MITKDDDIKGIPLATIKRLPLYYTLLKEKESGDDYISSTMVAESLRLSPILVRKDLAMVSSSTGKPRLGFKISQLIIDIENNLGYNNVDDAVLVGAGHLGRTLLRYEGFKNYGLNIVAAFDNDTSIENFEINGKKVFPMNQFEELVRRLNINIGIITVPEQYAQGVCDKMVKAGIKGIWNFASTHLNIPENIIIKNENLAAELARLSHNLSKKIR